MLKKNQMNKLFTLLFCLFLVNGISAQTVKKPIIFKKTATWCSNCGSWGWNFKNEIREQISEDEAIFFSLHFSGDLTNSLSQDFFSNFSGAGQPRFYINNDAQSVGSSTYQSKVADFVDLVSTINEQEPDFQTTISAYKSSTEPSITANISITPSILDFNMDYYLGVYLIEDGVVNFQQNQGTVPHPKVLRSSFTENTFGELFFGSGDSWTGYPLDFEFTLNGEDDDYLNADYLDKTFDVMFVIFSYDGSNYYVDQADIVSNVSVISSATDQELVNDAKIYQTSADNLRVEIETAENLSNVSYSIIDITGKELISGNVNFNVGNVQNIDINVENLNTNNYFFMLNSNGKVWSEAFSIVK